MTPAQKIAIENHCRFAFETAHPRFCRMVELPEFSVWLSVVVSVNSGYE